jgi:hypothetical protein
VVAGRSDHGAREGDPRWQGCIDDVAGAGAVGGKYGMKGELCRWRGGGDRKMGGH